MTEITIRYFARLRDERGLAVETVDTADATPGDLYDTLARRHGFTLGRDMLKVAVNDAFAPWRHTLADKDTVVFIPPVAGG